VFRSFSLTGDFFIPTYGVLVALAFLAGLWVTVRLARRSGINPELVTNLAVYCALAGIAGAKILMIIFDWDQLPVAPRRDFLVFHASGRRPYIRADWILAIVTAFLYVRRHGAALAEDIRRVRARHRHRSRDRAHRLLRRGCCWGKECDLPWCGHVPQLQRPNQLTGVPLHVALHPSSTL